MTSLRRSGDVIEGNKNRILYYRRERVTVAILVHLAKVLDILFFFFFFQFGGSGAAGAQLGTFARIKYGQD